MRLLVIVSGDYGELGLAASFVRGLATAQCTMLMPALLAHSMRDLPGVELRTYRDLAEVRRAVAQVRPEIVLFTSGYLLAINSGLTTIDSIRLVRTVRRLGATILTSDPFLGLARSPGALDFAALQAPTRDAYHAVIELFGWRQRLRLFVVGFYLRRAWHLYPAPVERLTPQPQARRVCYYNAAAQAPVARASADAPRTWLFIVSKTDYDMHRLALGEAFVSRIVERMGDGVALGRRVVMIGPKALVAEVRPRVGDSCEVAEHSDTTYFEYVDNLVAAEYAFFWNYYSFSVMHRLMAGRPVFFFDEGHMVRILPALGEAGIRMFYDGWRPPLLPLDRPLAEDELSRLETQVVEQFRRIAEGLRACPSPDEVLRRVSPGREARAA